MKKRSYSKSSKKASSKKTVSQKGKRAKTWDRSIPSLSANVYSVNTPHYFKRQLEDGVFYTNAPNSVGCVNATGGAPQWLSLAGATSDQGGVSNTLQFGFSITAALSYATAASEFYNLFQQYQITGLKLEISPLMGASTPSMNGQIPSLYIAEDYNDSTVPPNFAAIQQNSSVKRYSLDDTQTIVRFIRPVPAIQMYSSAVATSYATSTKDVWMDTTSPSAATPHYAFKCYVRNWVGNAANTGVGMRVQPTLYFRARGTH